MTERNFYPKLIIIGGSRRNSGKTEFACRLISKFTSTIEIVALKLSTVFPDEKIMNGSYFVDSENKIQLFRENSFHSGKDTSRFLNAGAVQSFYLKATDDVISEGIKMFFLQVDSNALIVCESNSLAGVIKPGLFVMVFRENNLNEKKRTEKLMNLADLLVKSSDNNFYPPPGIIKCNSEGWYID